MTSDGSMFSQSLQKTLLKFVKRIFGVTKLTLVRRSREVFQPRAVWILKLADHRVFDELGSRNGQNRIEVFIFEYGGHERAMDLAGRLNATVLRTTERFETFGRGCLLIEYR